MKTTALLRISSAAVAAVLLGLSPAPLLAGGAKITIINGNAPGVGFNDTTPAAPVGGNTGTTIGAIKIAMSDGAIKIEAINLAMIIPHMT